MSRRARAAAVAFTLQLVLFAAAPIARADDFADEADLQFNLGVERYKAADYRGALEHFLASNRLVKNRTVMFNIARSYDKLGMYPEAFRYYTRALEGETDQATRAQIEDALRAMAPNIAVLDVETDPPGAQIYLDRKDLGAVGNGPARLGVQAGTYTLIADMPGFEDATAAGVAARTGSTTHVKLALKRILGTIRVEGEAAGSTVRLDSEDAPPLGTAPGEFPAPPGRHTLLLSRPGYQTTQLIVDVVPKQTVVVRPTITAKTGTIVVNADERDAVIEVDGEPRGFTPAVVTIPVGRHHVRVVLRGFKTYERDVDISVNQQQRLDVALVASETVEAASRTTESVEDAPASVSIIPSQELRGMRYPNLAEALRGTRGVFISDDRGYAAVGFRGFGRPGDYGNRVLVLVDGQPMNDDWLFSSYVGYDLRTDLDDVDRIEVVRGPGSVLYGTSAFSGVINLVTRSRDVPDSREVGVSVSDYGMARARARVTQNFSKDAGVWTSVSAGHSSGRDFFFPEYVADGPPAVAGYARNMDSVDVGTWQGRVWYKDLTAQWSLNSHRKQLPTGEFETIMGDARTYQTDTRGMFEAKYEPKIGSWVQSLTRAHYNYYGYRGQFAHAPDNGGMENSKFDGHWVGAEQRFVLTPSKAVRFTAGGEYQDHFYVNQFDEEVQTGTLLNDNRTFQIGAGYALADLAPLERLKLSAGARLDTYSTFGSSLNPRVAVIAKPYTDGNVKVMFGKAFRAPSIYELFYTAGGGQLTNPNLQPENIYSGEIEYSHRFSPTVVGLVSGYVNYIRGLIALRNVDPTGATYNYQNTNAPVVTVGGEAELRREWKEGWMIAVSGTLQRTQYLNSESFSDLVNLTPNPALRDVPNAPPYLASLKGAVPILSRAVTAMSRFSVEGPRFDRNDTSGPDQPAQMRTEPAVIWDLVFSGQEQRWGLRWAFGFYNLFDWRWSVPVSPEFRQDTIVQNGRTVLGTAGITF